MKVDIRDQDHLRSLIRALRANNVAEEDDGMYHLEMHIEKFLQLQKDEDLEKVLEFMRPESKEEFKNLQAIDGWYGARITPTWRRK